MSVNWLCLPSVSLQDEFGSGRAGSFIPCRLRLHYSPAREPLTPMLSPCPVLHHHCLRSLCSLICIIICPRPLQCWGLNPGLHTWRPISPPLRTPWSFPSPFQLMGSRDLFFLFSPQQCEQFMVHDPKYLSKNLKANKTHKPKTKAFYVTLGQMKVRVFCILRLFP